MSEDILSRQVANWIEVNVAWRLPRRLRWKLSRTMGGRSRSWIQRLYDADGDYTLREMRARNCVFVHIPKCAGIAVAEALFGNYAGGHSTAEEYLSVFGARWFDQAFKFTFVRDPWSRTISAYDFLRRGGFNDADAAFANQHLKGYADINDFVERGLGRPEIRSWQHFQSQTHFLLDPRTQKLAVDYLGRFENIEDDFKVISKRLNVKSKLVEKNARSGGRKADDSLKLSMRSIDRIGDIYARDIAMLGYRDFVPPA